ncbi:MAG: hypothetical protein ACR2HP_16585 [Ilumatobacteraceae bacterium]
MQDHQPIRLAGVPTYFLGRPNTVYLRQFRRHAVDRRRNASR